MRDLITNDESAIDFEAVEAEEWEDEAEEWKDEAEEWEDSVADAKDYLKEVLTDIYRAARVWKRRIANLPESKSGAAKFMAAKQTFLLDLCDLILQAISAACCPYCQKHDMGCSKCEYGKEYGICKRRDPNSAWGRLARAVDNLQQEIEHYWHGVHLEKREQKPE